MKRMREMASLTARPQPVAAEGGGRSPRLHLLRAGAFPAYLVVPAASASPVALIVALHGAGAHAQQGLDLLAHQARDRGVALLAPESTGGTWDALHGRFGPDVAAIDEALRQAFDLVAVDPARICIAGISDGGSYALGLGLANGDLFTHLVAFSPGFIPAAAARGEPVIFVSHGTQDSVLPIDGTSRRIVPTLRARGYEVDYFEFEGGHHAPPEMRQAAIDWFLDGADV